MIGHNGTVDGEGKQRKVSHTFYGREKEVMVDGKAIREVEVTGQRSPEPVDPKKQKKVARRKSNDQAALNIACRDLGQADHEGWLLKKSGGHGLVPISWKKLWCVIKNGSLYVYRTSFDLTAVQIFTLRNYDCAVAAEKKKMAFKLSPKPSEDEVERKPRIFAAETEHEVNSWVELLSKVSSGTDISHPQDVQVGEYEGRRRLHSASPPLQAREAEEDGSTRKPSIRKSQPSAMFASNETTGMPSGFGSRTQSASAARAKKASDGAAPVGRIFLASGDVDEDDDTADLGASSPDAMYTSEEMEVEVSPAMREDGVVALLKPGVGASPTSAPVQTERGQTITPVASVTSNGDLPAEEASVSERSLTSPRVEVVVVEDAEVSRVGSPPAASESVVRNLVIGVVASADPADPPEEPHVQSNEGQVSELQGTGSIDAVSKVTTTTKVSEDYDGSAVTVSTTSGKTAGVVSLPTDADPVDEVAAVIALPEVECPSCEVNAQIVFSVLAADVPSGASSETLSREGDGRLADQPSHLDVTPVCSAPFDLGEDLDIPKLDSDSFADEMNLHLKLGSV